MNDYASLPDPADTSGRVVEMEEKLMFQQQALEDLNGVVLRQQTEIGELRRDLEACRRLLQSLADRGLGDDLPQEKPPHY